VWSWQATAQEVLTGKVEVCDRPEQWVNILKVHRIGGFNAGRDAFVALEKSTPPHCGLFEGEIMVMRQVGVFFDLRSSRGITMNIAIYEVVVVATKEVLFILMEKPKDGLDI